MILQGMQGLRETAPVPEGRTVCLVEPAAAACPLPMALAMPLCGMPCRLDACPVLPAKDMQTSLHLLQKGSFDRCAVVNRALHLLCTSID